MPYRLSTLAEQDLDEIWSYVADDASPETADRLIDDIVDRFNLLAEQPGMGRVSPEFGPGVQSFAVENYVVYYRQEGDVLIARVLHGRRDQIAAWSESAEFNRVPTAAASRRDPVGTRVIAVPLSARSR